MDTASALDWDELEEPMTDLPTPVQTADVIATDAALAFVTAVGVFEVIDRLRFSEPGRPIPAPGLAETLAEVRERALGATDEIAIAMLHVRAPDPIASPAATAAVVPRAEAHCDAARRGLRRLAQLGIGVAQHAPYTRDAEVAERAMMRLLANATVGAREDHAGFVGRTREELSVELVGLIVRLHIERATDDDDSRCVVVGAPGVDDVTVTIHDGGITVDDTQLAPGTSWLVVAATVLSRIAALDAAALERLTVRWPE